MFRENCPGENIRGDMSRGKCLVPGEIRNIESSNSRGGNYGRSGNKLDRHSLEGRSDYLRCYFWVGEKCDIYWLSLRWYQNSISDKIRIFSDSVRVGSGTKYNVHPQRACYKDRLQLHTRTKARYMVYRERRFRGNFSGRFSPFISTPATVGPLRKPLRRVKNYFAAAVGWNKYSTKTPGLSSQ